MIPTLNHRGKLIGLGEVAAEVAPSDRSRLEHHVSRVALRRAPAMERIVDEAEAVLGRELFQIADVRGDSRAILERLAGNDQVKVIDTSTLPLCNTSQRPNPETLPPEPTLHPTIERRPALRSATVPEGVRDLVRRQASVTRRRHRDERDRVVHDLETGEQHSPVIPETE